MEHIQRNFLYYYAFFTLTFLVIVPIVMLIEKEAIMHRIHTLIKNKELIGRIGILIWVVLVASAIICGIFNYWEEPARASFIITIGVMTPYIFARLFILSKTTSDPGGGKEEGKKEDKLLTELFFSPSLLAVACFLLIYEIITLYKKMHGNSYEPSDIYMALILSTTSVAFIGMHSIVHIVLEKNPRLKDFGMMGLLIIVAILLAVLIVVYYPYIPKHSNHP